LRVALKDYYTRKLRELEFKDGIAKAREELRKFGGK